MMWYISYFSKIFTPIYHPQLCQWSALFPFFINRHDAIKGLEDVFASGPALLHLCHEKNRSGLVCWSQEKEEIQAIGLLHLSLL